MAAMNEDCRRGVLIAVGQAGKKKSLAMLKNKEKKERG